MPLLGLSVLRNTVTVVHVFLLSSINPLCSVK